MKSVQFLEYGVPEAFRLLEIDSPEPQGTEVLISLQAAPLNPSDFLLTDGHYPFHPHLPSPAGSEAVGRVERCGDAVEMVSVGDQVLVLPTGTPRTWQERFIADETELIRVASDIPAQKLATLGVNGATAVLLLRYAPDLDPGQWIAQTAANSDVGDYIRALAHQRGLRVLDVVRRTAAADTLRQAGTDAVAVSGDGFESRVAEILGEHKLGLILDAVGGSTPSKLAAHAASGAHIVSYAALDGQPVAIHPRYLNFSSLHVDGFWLNHWLTDATQDEVRALYGELATAVREGRFAPRIQATFELARYREAIGLARTSGRNGKVLFVGDAS